MPLRPSLSSTEDVLIKCNFFVDTQLWPLKHVLNPEGWMSNFNDDERPYAAMLLNSFIYLSESLVNQIYIATISDLAGTSNLDVATDHWKIYRENVLVTFITGETPNLTDSGRIFARKARQLLGIPQENIVDPQVALELHISNDRPVLFVDDFVGTGLQCVETWKREIPTGRYEGASFDKVQKHGNPAACHYTPLVCTQIGKETIRAHCPELNLRPGHLLGSHYSALTRDSIVWPEDLFDTAVNVLRSMSLRAGIPEDLNVRNDWRGLFEQGLCLAFYHSVPDATLPIFFWEENGWIPLIRKN
jgi:hypothetical protein